jgi:23S rRNA (adenine2030-N6)-methyltransferase
MNYRHAFHAGNFADVHKHAILTLILVHLLRKPAAFRVIDIHAGAGRYDLFAAEPTRGGEWLHGIARIWGAWRRNETHPLLAPYLEAVTAFNPDGQLRLYPGSATLAQYLLRSQDRLSRARSSLSRQLHLAGPCAAIPAPRRWQSTGGWRSAPMCRPGSAAEWS